MQDAPPQLWHGELAQTAPLLRSALARLHGGPVMITTETGAPVTNGKLVAVMATDGPLLPGLTLEFTLRGMTFAIEIPLAYVFTLVASWTGQYYVFRIPTDARFQVEWPLPRRDEEAAAPPDF